MNLKNPGPPLKPGRKTNIHIGTDRYAKLTKVAIELGYRTGNVVTTSQVAQYMIDNYMDMAQADILLQHGAPLDAINSSDEE